MADDPGKLMWAALLGRWTDFAKSAIALPNNPAGRAMRDSVADVISLQAVWFALSEIDDLDHDQRALGVDRAAVLIEKHAGRLRERWGDDMPEAMGELIGDAVSRLRDVREAGPGPGAGRADTPTDATAEPDDEKRDGSR